MLDRSLVKRQFNVLSLRELRKMRTAATTLHCALSSLQNGAYPRASRLRNLWLVITVAARHRLEVSHSN